MLTTPFITISGADESTDIEEICELGREAEIGLLYCAGDRKGNRHPSMEWLLKASLAARWLSVHICGGTARREFFEGRLDDLLQRAQRIQINGKVSPAELTSAYNRYPRHTIITQATRANEPLLNISTHGNHVVLVDASGGRGITPEQWTRPDTSKAVGFAGGLGPDNLETELPKISTVAQGDWWVDMEANLRTDDWFDLRLARKAVQGFYRAREVIIPSHDLPSFDSVDLDAVRKTQESPEWRSRWRCASMHDQSGRRGIWYRQQPDGCLDVRAGREGDDVAVTFNPATTGKDLIAELEAALSTGAWMQEEQGPDTSCKPFLPHEECISRLGRITPLSTVTPAVIGDVLGSMMSKYDTELIALDREGLEKRWYFRYERTHSPDWNIYEFQKMLEIHTRECRRWEEKHHGSRSVVERVRETYLMPRIAQFRQDLTEHLLAIVAPQPPA